MAVGIVGEEVGRARGRPWFEPELLSQLIERVRGMLAGVAGEHPASGARQRRAHAAADLVTVGSIVRVFDLDALRERVVTIVTPEAADEARGRVGLDTPLGATLLGASSGDSVDFAEATARRRVRVVRVLGHLAELGESAAVRTARDPYWLGETREPARIPAGAGGAPVRARVGMPRPEDVTVAA